MPLLCIKFFKQMHQCPSRFAAEMELSPTGIPIIDLSLNIESKSSDQDFKDVAKRISAACQDTGCFYIRNHGISVDLITNVLHDFKIFFSQPVEYKMRFIDPRGNIDRGYEPFERGNVNAFMGRSGYPNDPLERYAFGPTAGFVRQVPPNIFPDTPATLKRNIESYNFKLRILAEHLMKLFSTAAGVENFFYHQCYQGEHILRANFYPKCVKPKSNQSTRFGEHTDSTPFTILTMDDRKKSLLVQNANGWIYADPIPGTLLVNLGDIMARWTNDRWKATVHKVTWPEGGQIEDRISIAYFLLMNPGVIVECLPSCIESGQKAKYDPISHADYVNAKMAKLAGRY